MESGQPETSLVWSLERLAIENLSCGTLVSLLRDIANSRGEQFYSDLLRSRIMLASLRSTVAITIDTLTELSTLDNVVRNSWERELAALGPALRVPSDLLLQVKTELVVQTWRSNVNVAPQEIILRIQQVFGLTPQQSDQARVEELMAAAANPDCRPAIECANDTCTVFNNLRRFVLKSQACIGSTFLELVKDDIQKGRYVPGSGLTLPLSQPAPPPSPPQQTNETGRQGQAVSFSQHNTTTGSLSRGDQTAGALPFPEDFIFPEIFDDLLEFDACLPGDLNPAAVLEAPAGLANATVDGASVEIVPFSAPCDAPKQTPGVNNVGHGLVPMPISPSSQNPMSPLPVQQRQQDSGSDAALESASRMKVNNRRINKRWTTEEVQALLEGCSK